MLQCTLILEYVHRAFSTMRNTSNTLSGVQTRYTSSKNAKIFSPSLRRFEAEEQWHERMRYDLHFLDLILPDVGGGLPIEASHERQHAVTLVHLLQPS